MIIIQMNQMLELMSHKFMSQATSYQNYFFKNTFKLCKSSIIVPICKLLMIQIIKDNLLAADPY